MENRNIKTIPIEQQVLSALKIVSHIATIVVKPTINDQDKETISRNVKHLEIMMQKDQFKGALTVEQKHTIETVIKNHQ